MWDKSEFPIKTVLMRVEVLIKELCAQICKYKLQVQSKEIYKPVTQYEVFKVYMCPINMTIF